MSLPRRIPDSVIAAQRSASDPEVSAWVSANAGSGKTHVLTQRVISLLLKGADPAKILCITFTKAAAANMASGVFKMLAEWTTLDDATLDARLAALGAASGIAARARARQLFALALETPGGLKVQTIHAFCTRLLHQFPFEADVAARFTVLDEAAEHQLLEKLILEVMLEGAASPDSALGAALQTAIAAAADRTLHEVIREAVRGRDAFLQWTEGAGSVDAAIAQLSRALGLAPEETLAQVEARFLSEALIAPQDWSAVAARLAAGQKSDRSLGAQFAALQGLMSDERRARYLSIFCTGQMTPRQRLVTKALADADPALADLLLQEQSRVCAVLETCNAARCRDRSRALLTLAHEIIRRYRIEKDRRGLLDYDDLIDKTLALLRKTSAAWVLFKLDLGVDHVLIDEAQDTSAKQWDIIATLVGEFTAGFGARPARRTLFAVGDDKQSIFSFQGAAPDKFAEMHRQFHRAFAGAELELRTVRLQTSFRSGEMVLSAVDRVFAQATIYRSLTADDAGIPPHIALPDAAPGCVDIWPLTLPAPKEKPEGWDAPFDMQSETSPPVVLARRIARNIARWISGGIAAGDILILVRQRGPLFEAIIRALKETQIPVAGADRLVLTEHIAVMDLIALAEALLLPQDDLALATVLKSPLFGVDDDVLFSIAHGRGGKSLREALLARGHAPFAEAASRIQALTDEARRLSPFAFYTRLLGPGGGRKQFLARLGPEANDALDEFLNLALDYESRETPSLQGFVAWLRAAQADVKRDMEQGRDEVRVMTVHGAKGLEAPLVVLADTTTRPAGYHPPKLIPLALGGLQAVVWAGSRNDDPPLVAEARARLLRANEDEYRRLLYVAMTRARARLIICGIGSGQPKQNGDDAVPDGCWYQLVKTALLGDNPQGCETDAEDGEGRIWRYAKAPPSPTTPVQGGGEAPDHERPGWLLRPADALRASEPPVSPADAFAEDGAASRALASAERGKAILRGRLVHRLMQSLPDLPAARREEAAHNYLERAGNALEAAERKSIRAQVFRILNDARFAPLFGPGSRAEVPLIGQLARPGRPPRAVSGQVDRLLITPEMVLIADYKTNHAPPHRLDEALADYPGYVLQLALYRALLQAIRPGVPVRAALVWTETAALMDIPPEALEAALARLTAP